VGCVEAGGGSGAHGVRRVEVSLRGTRLTPHQGGGGVWVLRGGVLSSSPASLVGACRRTGGQVVWVSRWGGARWSDRRDYLVHPSPLALGRWAGCRGAEGTRSCRGLEGGGGRFRGPWVGGGLIRGQRGRGGVWGSTGGVVVRVCFWARWELAWGWGGVTGAGRRGHLGGEGWHGGASAGGGGGEEGRQGELGVPGARGGFEGGGRGVPGGAAGGAFVRRGGEGPEVLAGGGRRWAALLGPGL